MNYVILSEVITRDYYFNRKEEGEIIIQTLRMRPKNKSVLVFYFGTNYDNRINFDYRLSVEIRRVFYEIRES